jgi:3-(3-hydroxy-phenyl)propionate hydroxylase
VVKPHFAIIVGGGPVGLMLANLMGADGASVLVLEKRSTPYTAPRAIAYDSESLRMFQKISLLDALEPSLERDVPVVYFNQRGRELMRMSNPERPYGHSQVGTFYQPELEAVLNDGIKRFDNVDVLMGMMVTGFLQDQDGVTVHYNDEAGRTHSARGDFMIGCDGGSSFVRSAAGIPFAGHSFAEQWLVVDCEDEGYGVREMQFFCDPRRPALTLPVSKGRRRWEFLLMPGDDRDTLVLEPSVRRLIAQYAPQDKSRIERSLIYTFHARFADRFLDGRVILAGDAAHVSPPFAGQGLNSGFRDAHNLSWRLDLVRRGVSERTLLESYETERLPHVKALTQFSILLGKAVMPTTRLKAVIRDMMFGIQNIIPGGRNYVDKGGAIPRPHLSKNAVRGSHKRSGHMLVQPLVAGYEGDPVLLDTIIGKGWAVIGVDTDPQQGLHTDDAALCVALGAQYLSIKSADAPALAKQIGVGQIALVRPDRYIAEIFSCSAEQQSLKWLGQSLKLSPEKKQIMDIYPELARAHAPIAKAQDLAFAMFERPDLDLAERFLIDFGFTCIERTASRMVMRAAHDVGPAYVATKGPKAKFLGLALRVKSRADLDALSAAHNGAPVLPLQLPAGGWHVRLKDPAGFDVWAVADQESIGVLPMRAPLPMNTPIGHARVNNGIRPLAGPATILRPGHCVLGVTEFLANARWYIDMFGLIPSDIQTLEDGTPALVFLRCDRGSDPADHHSIVVSQNVANIYSHSAYEVTDIDDLATGQEHLLSKKWKHAWGIGRHVLGSQIFDYWRDPWNDKVEHFADGDVFDSDAPTGISTLSAASLYQWGPGVPGDFEKPKLTPAFVWKVIGNIRRSPELSIKKVRMLLAAIEAPARPWIK